MVNPESIEDSETILGIQKSSWEPLCKFEMREEDENKSSQLLSAHC